MYQALAVASRHAKKHTSGLSPLVVGAMSVEADNGTSSFCADPSVSSWLRIVVFIRDAPPFIHVLALHIVASGHLRTACSRALRHVNQ